MTKQLWVTALAAIVACVVAAVATAAGGPLALKGSQIPIDESKGEYAMKGGLIGNWYVESFDPTHRGKDGRLVASGKESFLGCHDLDGNGKCDSTDSSGTLRFTYMYWATFTKSGALVRGECVHPITGGTGGFAKSTGFVHMWDKPAPGKKVVTTYTGVIQYANATTTSVGSSDSSGARTLESAGGARGGCGSTG
jgi:hypothetical protein